MKTKKVALVQCTYIIPVEIPADWDDDKARLHIEDCGCPGAGIVGAAFLRHYKEQTAQSMCWSCTLPKGENKIVSIRLEGAPSPQS
jgi:hypothetical protein